MGMHGGRDAEGGDGAGRDDGWDLFGPDGLDGVAGLVGDGRDSRHVRGVDYTAAVRMAKSGEWLVSRALERVMCPGARVVTYSWSTELGEPMVRVELEMSGEVWRRWVARVEEIGRCVRAYANGPLPVGDVPRARRRGSLFSASLRRVWVRRPASLAAPCNARPED
jgi:hypothetical protein